MNVYTYVYIYIYTYMYTYTYIYTLLKCADRIPAIVDQTLSSSLASSSPATS